MQQFLVPQFIDVENKILGPITVRQFVIMIVIMGTLFIFYKTLDFAAFVLAAVFTLAIGAAFGFLKVNGAPFHVFLLNVTQTSLRPSLRVWNKTVKNINTQTDKNKNEDALNDVQLISSSAKLINTTRLSELSLIVNTGGYYKGENY